MNEKELVVEGRIAKIPEGYSWCMGCNALTPHKRGKKSKYSYKLFCIICGDYKLTDYGNLCPNCGYDAEADMEGPGQYEHIIHYEGCHCKDNEDELGFWIGTWATKIAVDFRNDWMKPSPDRGSWAFSCKDPKDEEVRKQYDLNRKLKNQWLAARDVKCGCPRYTIYTSLNIFNAWSQPVYSMDCMNAMEWGFDIRCPICGFIWEYETGNC